MAENPPSGGMSGPVWEWLTGGDEDAAVLCEGAGPDGGAVDD